MNRASVFVAVKSALTLNVQFHHISPGAGPVLCLTCQVVAVVSRRHVHQVEDQLLSIGPENPLRTQQHCISQCISSIYIPATVVEML